MHGGRERIVVTEIPYMVNKLRLIEKIAELVKDKKIEGISDIYDSSSGDDIKIIIELKKDVNANVILNQLYKFHTASGELRSDYDRPCGRQAQGAQP